MHRWNAGNDCSFNLHHQPRLSIRRLPRICEGDLGAVIDQVLRRASEGGSLRDKLPTLMENKPRNLGSVYVFGKLRELGLSLRQAVSILKTIH